MPVTRKARLSEDGAAAEAGTAAGAGTAAAEVPQHDDPLQQDELEDMTMLPRCHDRPGHASDSQSP
jgi:hypothetical protein